MNIFREPLNVTCKECDATFRRDWFYLRDKLFKCPLCRTCLGESTIDALLDRALDASDDDEATGSSDDLDNVTLGLVLAAAFEEERFLKAIADEPPRCFADGPPPPAPPGRPPKFYMLLDIASALTEAGSANPLLITKAVQDHLGCIGAICEAYKQYKRSYDGL